MDPRQLSDEQQEWLALYKDRLKRNDLWFQKPLFSGLIVFAAYFVGRLILDSIDRKAIALPETLLHAVVVGGVTAVCLTVMRVRRR